MPTIAIDIQSTVGAYSGLGVYTRRLIDSLAPAHDFQKPLRTDFAEFHFFSVPSARPWHTLDRLWWENRTLPQLCRRHSIDLLHVPAFSPPLCRPKRCKVVTTVHDLIGMLFPNQIGRVSRYYWGKWLPYAVKRSDKIIADSESTRRDLMEHLDVPSEKIRVIHLSGHEGFRADLSPEQVQTVKQALGIRENYFLFVGTIEPRKNLGRVIQAFAEFLKSFPAGSRYQLVVVGSKDFAHGEFLRRLVKEHPETKTHVFFTGYVPQDSLNALYQGARAFLYPSLYEGFGIPVLEAMGSGTPVVASRVSSVPEIAGDAALLVDPENTAEITGAMRRLAEEDGLCESLRNRGHEQKKKFSWQKTSREVLEVYQEVLGERL